MNLEINYNGQKDYKRMIGYKLRNKAENLAKQIDYCFTNSTLKKDLA